MISLHGPLLFQAKTLDTETQACKRTQNYKTTSYPRGGKSMKKS